MDQYEHIRTAHRVYGEPIRALARRTRHSRETIRKALRAPYEGYRQRNRQPYPVLGAYIEIIDGWLEADRERPRKQRHTAERVFQRLVAEHGFPGSVSNVRRYVHEAKERLGIAVSRAFIPLAPELGREAEVDWGTATAVIAGVETRVKVFCMRSKGSGKPFVRLYPCERQQAFFDGMQRGFAFFGGVFRIMIFDNLTSAVQKVLQGTGRIEQEAFRQFRSYHSFEARFCNPASGNEKGGVEGLVGFSRRNFLVPVPSADTLEAINEQLLAQCMIHEQRTTSGQEKTVGALFVEERPLLMPLPLVPYEIATTVTAKVDKYATVVVDRNRYSVPTRLVGCIVRVICSVETLEIFQRGKRVAHHRRVYGAGKWQLDPDHYLDLLRQRPRAFDDARPIREWRSRWSPEMLELLERFRRIHGESDGTKEFIDVLLLYRDHPGDRVTAAITQAHALRMCSCAGVRHVLTTTHRDIPPVHQYACLPTADVAVYGVLGGVR
jgi:transposase